LCGYKKGVEGEEDWGGGKKEGSANPATPADNGWAGALARRSLGEGGSPASEGNRSGRPTTNRTPRSRASHVDAGAGIDLDHFALLDEKRDVDGPPGLELCRLGDVTGRVAAHAFR